MLRRRSTFEEKIADEKAELVAQAAELRPGPELDALRRKIRQLDTASQIRGWLSSPGLHSPR